MTDQPKDPQLEDADGAPDDSIEEVKNDVVNEPPPPDGAEDDPSVSSTEDPT